ncbi:dethiobiotin synthase [Candidatus Haliotispira prima]|uniref:ATP-dependent dethiobiotin synthetase BioD n=1 Tax=Candidatus Haliotispira prima TaxID=3034016 RepID=A0ABY8MFF0_9SPIO|nr:dethiobiotin synthase [Candidatus Haliotispira prima]
MQMQGFFITATNTDRGKTLVTAALRLWLQKRGLNCLAMKSVQTGMEGRRLSPDLYSIYALDYSGRPKEDEVLRDLDPLLHLLQPYCYQEPCSPHLAAERDGLKPVDLQHLKHCARELQDVGGHCDFLLVEGAGGFYVPIDRDRQLTVADIAEELGLPIILVARNELGTINETCLSLLAMRQRGLAIAGFLLNDSKPAESLESSKSSAAVEAVIREDNPRIIAELSGVPYLGSLPFQPRAEESAELLRSFEGLCGLDALNPYLP